MTGGMMAEEWRAEMATARKRRMAAWIGSPILIVAGLAMLRLGLTIAPGGVRWLVLAAGGAAAIGGFLWGTIFYLRVVDEQEREANLWGCYVGMCVYLALFSIHTLFEGLNQPPPFGHFAIFSATMVTVMGVFLWRRGR